MKAQNSNNHLITKDDSNDYKSTTGDSFHHGASFDYETQESNSLDNSINESESIGNSNLEPEQTENSNSFKEQNSFKENQKSSIAAHQCHICTKTFKLKYNLTAHIKLVHSNLKRFECKTCLERFVRIEYLRKHLTKCKPVKVSKLRSFFFMRGIKFYVSNLRSNQTLHQMSQSNVACVIENSRQVLKCNFMLKSLIKTTKSINANNATRTIQAKQTC